MDVLLNKNTAHDYTIESTYESYLQNRIDQENKISLLLSECTILNEANTGIVSKTKRLTALYEAGIKDTIKAKFNRFIEFLKGIWGKFMSNMTKVLADEQTYLKKYADIIQNKKGKSDIDISYYGNYDKGITRINQVVVPPFDWNTMHEALSDSENAYGKFFALNKITGMSGFEYDENTDLAGQLKEFFIGGEDGQQKTTMSSMDLRSMYNFCWNFKKIQQVTEKDIKNMEASANKIFQAVDNNLKENPKPDTQTPAKPESGGNNGAAQIEKPEESTSYFGFNSYLHEEEANQDNGGDKKDAPVNKTTLNISKGSGSFDRQDDETQKNNADAQSNDIMNSKGDKSNEDVSKEVTTVINNYTTVCRAVITAKWTAAEQIAKDYMNIIKTHVNSYVGKSYEKDNNAKAQKYTTDEGKGIKNNKNNNGENKKGEGQSKEDTAQKNDNPTPSTPPQTPKKSLSKKKNRKRR